MYYLVFLVFSILKMISIDKIIQQLQQCKDTAIILPQKNTHKYIQKTAIEIRKDELLLLNTNFEHLNEANFTMDSEYDKLNKENETIKQSIENVPKTFNQEIIPHKSLIIYNENETAQLPETLLKLFNYFDPIINVNLLYLYGVKNPESFYKSFLLLTKVDFIIKNNTEKKNEVATFKREMAVQYETFYKTLNYRKFKFSRNNMVSNLTNIDNYVDYDLYQYIADYTKYNFIILDIINEKYIDIYYNQHDLTPNHSNSHDNSNSNSNSNSNFIIIIKYSANTFLPLMQSNGCHTFDPKILQYISKTYERLIFTKYKEPKDVSSTDTTDTTDITDTTDKIEDTDNILDQYKILSIEEAFNNSIKLQVENSISNGNNISTIIEDMSEDIVEIEEIETTPMSSSSSMSMSIPISNNTIVNTKPIEINSIMPITPIDTLQTLMGNIPMSKGSKIKVEKPVKPIKLVKTTPITVLTILDSDNKQEAKIQTNEKKTETKTDEELLPIGKYNLLDLQGLALLHKLETQKMGTMGKKINKLKSELYLEIAEKLKK